MGKAIDLTGQRFGRWTVLCKAEKGNDTRARWLCQCDCGNTAIVYGYSLRSGGSLSCGCLRRDRASETHRVHGESSSRLHYIWSSMLQRCNNPHVEKYPRYGGRGISVCPQWKDFSIFREWAISSGYTDALSLDRINVNGNYAPDNCRWVTLADQHRNKSSNRMLSLNGQTKCLVEWAELLKISRQTLQSRLASGWSIEDTLTTPVGQKRKKP